MRQYRQLMQEVLNAGQDKTDRTGVNTRSLFGYQMRFNLNSGFPLVTGKAVPFKAVLSELLWFLSGSSNVHDLRAILHGDEHRLDIEGYPTIWDANYLNQAVKLGYENGDLGPVYGEQWCDWMGHDGAGIDQIANVIRQIKNNPDSRRLIVSAWNPSEVDYMALPPCHCLFQFYVHEGKLSCQLYQRSADVFLGVPFNIASYALLTMMIAQVCGLGVGEFIWTGGDTHLYNNHMEQARQYLNQPTSFLPTVVINPLITDINEFTMQDFALMNYKPGAAIKAPMAV